MVVVNRSIRDAARDLCTIVGENPTIKSGALNAAASRLAARIDVANDDDFTLTDLELALLMDVSEVVAQECVRPRPPLRFNLLAMRVVERFLVPVSNAAGYPGR